MEGVRLEINGFLIAEGGAPGAELPGSRGRGSDEGPGAHPFLLSAGDASGEVWTTDLSYDYVKINAEYRSLGFLLGSSA